MPEGDTIYRTARRLAQELTGRTIEHALVSRPDLHGEQIAGRKVTRVEPRGKHLLIHLDNLSAIHSHLGMTGSWHIYQRGGAWRKPASRAAIVLEVAATAAVCFTPKTLELLSHRDLACHPRLAQLGPDILAQPFDPRPLVDRFRQRHELTIGQALMDQRIVCGIGNVYKSEVLFLCRVHPLRTIGELSGDDLLRLVQTARRLMRRNLEGFPRRTRSAHDGSRHWVYGRAGRPCIECGQSILVLRQGELARSTYWCPGCQRDDRSEHFPGRPTLPQRPEI